MNQLVGHLRPEPYPRLLHPHPVSLNSARAQPVKEARDNSPFPYCLYYLAPGSMRDAWHGQWGWRVRVQLCKSQGMEEINTHVYLSEERREPFINGQMG